MMFHHLDEMKNYFDFENYFFDVSSGKERFTNMFFVLFFAFLRRLFVKWNCYHKIQNFDIV